jgi:ABC-type Na+ efflux pump permease subunit
MKRIVTIALTMFLVFLIPPGIISAQEKKDEQKIKIIVVDKDGTKVVIDSVMKGENGEKMIMKHVTVSDSDTEHLQHISEGEGGNVVIISSGTHATEGPAGKTITWTSSEGHSGDVSYIYIDKGNDTVKVGEKSYKVKVITDEKDNNVEKTKYVIAKDGMVVTVEGNDEAKVKEMIKEIEAKLGVSKEDKNGKEVAKEETKKTTKK